MDRRATKDSYEREQEEAERLVRPAPKVKPPRHDRRRNRLQPDVEKDPDVEQDRKDRSMNFKDVGASDLVHRVAERFMFAFEHATRRERDQYLTDHPDADPEKHTVKDEKDNEGSADEEDEKDNEGSADEEKDDEFEPKARPSHRERAPSSWKSDLTERQKAEVKSFYNAGGAKNEKFKQYASSLPDGKTDPATGETLFRNPTALGNAPKFVKFEKLDPSHQHEIISKFRERMTLRRDAEAVSAALSEAQKRVVLQLDDPSSPVSKRIQKLTREEGIDPDHISIDRVLPQLKGAKLPPSIETLGALQRLFEAEPDVFATKDAEQRLKDFLEKGVHKSTNFKAFVERAKDISLDKDGQPLFYDDERKQRVPFHDLEPRRQEQIVERFEEFKHENGLRTLQQDNPKLRAVLQDLANPESDLARRLSEDRESGGHFAEKAIPELHGIWLPARYSTVDGLAEIAKKLHPPIPQPKRRDFDPEEQEWAARDILFSIPPDKRDPATAEFVFGHLAKLHPDDMKEAWRAYQAGVSTSLRSLDDVPKAIREGYEVNPDKVRPPAFHVNEKGDKVPFDTLSPEEQAEVYRRHQAHTVALSLATKHRFVDMMQRAGAPSELANTLSNAVLVRHPGEAERERVKRLQGEAKTLFENVIDEGTPVNISPGKASSLLDHLSSDPAARRLAVGYLQANDYLRATKAFSDPRRGITEHSSPRQIVLALIEASNALNGRDSLYGADSVHSPARLFRERIIDKLNLLAPGKVESVRKQLKGYEAKEYERKQRAYEKARKQYEREHKNADPFRVPPPPVPPEKPVGYRGKGTSTEEHRRLMEEQLTRMGLGKTAARVASRFIYSSYPSQWSMGKSTTALVREAVYHGVAPYPEGHEGFEPYAPWSQAHQRDIDESDLNKILTAAREWLKAPVLSVGIEGIERDTQLRAALDLAIRDMDEGRYAAGLYPQVYNTLLARLAGESESETLLTTHTAGATSPYAATHDEETPMKLSKKLAAYATKISSSQPEIAYDLMGIVREAAEQETAEQQQQSKQAGQLPPALRENAEKMKEKAEKKAEDDKEQQKQASYAELRSLVIRTAAADPIARERLMPVLQFIKQRG